MAESTDEHGFRDAGAEPEGQAGEGLAQAAPVAEEGSREPAEPQAAAAGTGSEAEIVAAGTEAESETAPADAPATGDAAGPHPEDGAAEPDGEPAVAEGEPAVADSEPAVAAGEAAVGPPAAAEGSPAVAEGEPAVAEGEPAVAEGEPAVAEGEPAVAEGEPAVAEGEPAVAESEPAVAGDGAAVAEPESEASSGDQDAGVPELRPGQIVDGVVARVEQEQLLVDVGYKSEGVVPLAEVRLRPGEMLEETFAVGQPIAVAVLAVEGQEGGPLLSHRRALEARAWRRLEEAHSAGEVVTAQVTDQVKGGLVIDVGLRGFMPASHVERGYVNDLSGYVGQPIRAKVIEIDRGKNRVILSQKAVLEEEYRKLRDKTWGELAEGQVRRGVVKGLTDFGAFVDLGGVDGLLHVSEMAWGRVEQPSDVLNVGDEINVKILRLDRDKEKISLGLKQVLPDPWETVEEHYPAGSMVDGKVMRLAPFGAFVQLEPGVEGLVHISQLADYHVHDPSEVVREGQSVRVKVLRVSSADRRISLSIRDAERTHDRAAFHHGLPGSPHHEPVTLGDMFGRLFDQAKERLEDDERGR